MINSFSPFVRLLCLLLLLCLPFTACKRKNADAASACESGHTAGDWSVLLDATEKTDGKRQKLCTVCGVTLEIESIPATGEGTADAEGQALLHFELLEDSTYGVRVTAAAKAAKTLTVPETHEGKPVTRLLTKAFAGCEALTELTLPDTLCAIGDEAFLNCIALQSISIPSSVQTVGKNAFAGCTALSYYTDENAYAKYLGNVENKYLLLLCFYGNTTSCGVINDATRIICQDAFSEAVCASVLLPSALCRMEASALASNSLERIYYSGDAAALARISLADDLLNTDLLYFFSNTSPDTEGRYWHYVQGVPTLWK